jgi:hypothetical protein
LGADESDCFVVELLATAKEDSSDAVFAITQQNSHFLVSN